MSRVNRTKNETGKWIIIRQDGDVFRVVDLSYGPQGSGPVYHDKEVAKGQAARVGAKRIYIAKLEATK